MASLPRILLVCAALLSGGVLQVASALDEAGCCAGEPAEQDRPCTDCPPGLACACCPLRATVGAAPVVAPPRSSGAAVAVVAVEPSVGPAVTDIFHPPRA